MKKINNKGFTLIELLVTMAILGIVTTISLPLIRNVQQAQEKKKYTSFQDNMVYGAKLYVDSYGEDLFGHNDAGCAYIDFEKMLEKNIAKDIQIDKSTCVSQKTYVKVVKLNNQYTYVPYVTCGTADASGGFSNVIYSYPEGNHERDDTCSIDSAVNMSIATSVGQTEESSQRTAIKISISSYTGFNTNVEIYYGFSENDNDPNIFTEWQKATFKVPSQSTQRNKILKSGGTNEQISISSNDIYTPDGYNGSAYLVLRIDRLMDLTGKNWTNDGTRYIYYGPYRLDNITPVINYASLKNQDGKWYLLGNVTDEHSYEEKIFVCTSYNADTCPNYLNDKSKYEEVSSQLDFEQEISLKPGSELSPKVYLRVSDSAGNTTAKNFIIPRVIYSVKFDYNGATINSNTYEYRTIGVDNSQTAPTWGMYVTIPTRQYYSFLGWSTAESPNTYIKSTDVFKPVSVLYARWAPNDFTITYNLNAGTVSSGNPTKYNIETAKFTLNNPTKTGYTFAGWTGTGLTSATKTVSVAKGSTGNRSYTANWTPTSYNITYNLDGGTISGGTNPSTYTIETASFTLKNPTKTGYTFAGWTGTGLSTTTKTVTVAKGSTGAKTYTAKWTKN